MSDKKIPGLGSYKDRHGKTRWRYRTKTQTVMLPGEPGMPEFRAKLDEVMGAGPPARAKAEVRVLKSSGLPRTLRAGWRQFSNPAKSAEWHAFNQATKDQYLAYAERFLSDRVDGPQSPAFGDVLVEHIARRHVKLILARYADTPHAATRILRIIRKIISVALDEEWITVDPTYGVKWSPAYEGWRAWTAAELALFEARWPVGTTPRLCYAIALWTGLRRSDVVRLRWSDVDLAGGQIQVVTVKGEKSLILPIYPDLRAALEATPRAHEVILVTQYKKPFTNKALGMRMANWTASAGIGTGATIHGLRKTLGATLAEHGATTRELMGMLGHSAIAHAELYSRAAEQKRLAASGMDKLQSRPILKKIPGGKGG
jgi:integrase